MSNSPLVTKNWPADAGNYTAGRQGSGIWGIVIHHAAATSLDSVGRTFATPGRYGSAHYGVEGNNVHQYVSEENGAWHCGDYWANMGTVGIETINSTGAPSWLVSDATFNMLVKLVADIAKRNNLGVLKFDPDGYCPNLSAHRDWAQTACPGDYLYSKMTELAKRANEINYPPAKPKISWTDLPKALGLFTARSCSLVDLDTGKAVKTYSANTKIDVVQSTEFNGVKYYRTEYSKTKGFNWAFKAEDFAEPEVVAEPTPIEEEPSAPIGTSEIPQDNKNGTNSDESPSQDGSAASSKVSLGKGGILTAIAAFLKKIIKLLTIRKDK